MPKSEIVVNTIILVWTLNGWMMTFAYTFNLESRGNFFCKNCINLLKHYLQFVTELFIYSYSD